MPTNYTGVSTATQAPSGAPEPEGAPIVALPADADPPNASAFAQAYKALADWVTFALAPKAKASDWAKWIQVWRSGANKKRFGIDHLGFPAGKIVSWQESWQSAYSTGDVAGTDTVSNVDPVGCGWTIQSTKQGAGTARVSVKDPSTVWAGSRYVKFEVADTVGDYIKLSRFPQARFFDDNCIAMEWDLQVDVADGAKRIVIGFNPSGAGGVLGAIIQFRVEGLAEWQCDTGDGSSASGGTSGVMLDGAWHRYRIEWHGANADDANTAHALFFIDGVMVLDVPTTLPSVAAAPKVVPQFYLERLASGSGVMFLTPVRYSANTWLDAF